MNIWIFGSVSLLLNLFLMVLITEYREYDFFERMGRSVIYTTVWNIVLAMILAICGKYHILTVCIVDGVLALGFLFWILIKRISFRKAFYDWKSIFDHKWMILILLVIGILYAAFPTNYMLGGRDPGLYYLNGIHVAMTGGYQYEEDLFLTEHYEDLNGVVIPGYAGVYSDLLYGYSENAGKVTPQFMPMFASAMAIGYDLGNIRLMIRTNCWIGIMSLLVIYYFLKRNLSKRIAMTSVLLLAVSPAEIWYCRNSVSEILLQLLIFLSLDYYAQGFVKKQPVFALLAGILMGLGVMDRIDAYILGVPIFAVLIYAILFSKKTMPYAACTGLGYLVLGGLSYLYGITWSRPYFEDHMRNNGSLMKILLLNLAMILMVIAVYLWDFFRLRLFQSKRIRKNYIFVLFQKPAAVMVLYGLMMVVWIYAYAFRAIGEEPGTMDYFIKHNIVELSWYVSPAIMILMIVGFVGILYKRAEKLEHLYLFLLVGISNYVGYGIHPYVSMDHIWAARRWVTIIIPYLIIMGVVGIRVVYHAFRRRSPKLWRGISIATVAALFVFMLYQSKPFITTSIMKGLDAQLETINQHVRDDQIYITDNEEVASYLHYIYGKKVYRGSFETQEQIEDYINRYGELYFIGNRGQIAGFHCNKELVLTYKTEGLFLDKTIGVYPRELYDRTRDADIYRLSRSE